MGEQKTLEQLIMEAIDFCTHTRCKKCEYSGKDTADDYKGKCRGRMMADHLRKNGVVVIPPRPDGVVGSLFGIPLAITDKDVQEGEAFEKLLEETRRRLYDAAD